MPDFFSSPWSGPESEREAVVETVMDGAKAGAVLSSRKVCPVPSNRPDPRYLRFRRRQHKRRIDFFPTSSKPPPA